MDIVLRDNGAGAFDIDFGVPFQVIIWDEEI
jgi:hypothetical protein